MAKRYGNITFGLSGFLSAVIIACPSVEPVETVVAAVGVLATKAA